MKTIYIEMPISELPEEQRDYYVINVAKGITHTVFENGHFYMEGQEIGGECYYDEFVKSWLKPISVDDLPEVKELKERFEKAFQSNDKLIIELGQQEHKDICGKCGTVYDDILGIGLCGKCFFKQQNHI